MRSAIVLTEEIDDLDAAVKELVDGIHAKLELGRSSVGLVYCDAEADAGMLGQMLSDALGFDVIGLTVTAFMEREVGYCDIGISLCVLTGDDIDFAVGGTQAISRDRCVEQMRAAYTEARAKLPSDPKLIITCVPFITDITSETYVETLDEISGGVPVFGGVASDHYELMLHRTFHNGKADDSSLQFILISGAISPVFAMKHRFSADIEHKRVITEAEANHILKMGDSSFVSYLSMMTQIPDTETLVYSFQSTPFIMELPDYGEGEEPVVRALFSIDAATEAGIFLSKMPVGSRLGVSVINADDIRHSCSDTLDLLLSRMREKRDSEGAEFSTVLVSSCNGRYVLMGDRKDLEANILHEKLSAFDGLSAMGFYAFGEICPTLRSSGKTRNRYHNLSFAVCAF